MPRGGQRYAPHAEQRVALVALLEQHLAAVQLPPRAQGGDVPDRVFPETGEQRIHAEERGKFRSLARTRRCKLFGHILSPCGDRVESKTVRECTNRAEAINRLHTVCPKE